MLKLYIVKLYVILRDWFTADYLGLMTRIS